MPTIRIGANTADDFPGCEETRIRETAPTTNYGTDTVIEASRYGSGDHANGLIAFSGLSNIPAGATITAVSLSLYIPFKAGTNNTIAAYRSLRSWVQSQATWNIWSTGNNWTTGGGQSGGNDRAAAASSGSVAIDGTVNPGDRVVFTGAGMISDVQDWVNGASNYGWHLERNDGASNDLTYTQFHSSDAGDTARPYLEVTYTEGGVVTPARIIFRHA